MLVFANPSDYVQALNAHFDSQIEGLIEWEESIGFNSLFLSLEIYSDWDKERALDEIASNNLDKFIYWDASLGGLNFYNHNFFNSRMLNKEGLVRVGNYIGTTRNDKDIWVHKDDIRSLKIALKTNDFSSVDLIIPATSVSVPNSPSRMWTETADCPLNQNFDYRKKVYESSENTSTRKRWLQSEAGFTIQQFPRGTNDSGIQTFSYFAGWYQVSKSLRGKNKRSYNARHNQNTSITYANFDPNSVDYPVTRTYGSTNYGRWCTNRLTLLFASRVTQNWISVNGLRMLSINSTNSTHDGMGESELVNYDCN